MQGVGRSVRARTSVWAPDRRRETTPVKRLDARARESRREIKYSKGGSGKRKWEKKRGIKADPTGRMLDFALF